ncbi:MAG: SurA N-terminal domain-containing protein [Lentimicrobiaceae bacterium]|nr:SurA N-terminal domain-containing protein [Lentimicrobiaceae bacterium]
MAVIGKIRKRSGLLVVVIGIALAAFILGDFSRKSSKGSNNVGKIDGEAISITDYNAKVDENTNLRKLNSGNENLSAEENFNIRNSTWDQMVNDVLMNAEYDELGIAVSEDELEDQILGKHPHMYIQQNFKDPQTGIFDPALVKNFLENLDKVEPQMKERYLYIEKAIKQDRIETKLKNLISKGYYVPKAFAQMDFIDKNRSASIRYFAAKYSDLADNTIKLTDADYEKYYNENKFRYQQEDSRDIDYIVFEALPSEIDRKKITEEVGKLYEEFKTTNEVPSFINAVSDSRFDSTWHKKGTLAPRIDSVMFSSQIGTFYGPYEENNIFHVAKLVDVQMRPDSMKASHILISYTGAQVREKINRTKERASQIADSLLMLIKRDASQFEVIAKKLSDDQSVKSNGGDLGWFADGTMVTAFNNAVMNGKTGDIVKCESPFGFHVIKITGKKEPVKNVKVAMLDLKIEPSNQTFQETYVKASSFQGGLKTADDFENTVKKQGLNKRNAQYLRQMDYTIPGIKYAREIIRWAYHEDTKKGSISQVFDVEGSYVVAVLKEIREKGIASLEQIKQQIEPLVKRDKKAETLTLQINSAMASVKDINQLAAKFNAKTDTISITFATYNLPQYGRETEVIGKTFTLKPGIVSKPIKGTVGVFVVIVDNFTEPTAKTDYKQDAFMMYNNFAGTVNRELYTIMKDNANIKDNRWMFY